MLIHKDPDFKQHSLRLDEAEYARAMLALPILCADIVFIHRRDRMFYLADRIAQPVKGWWWIGGRVLRGEPVEEAATRKVREETGLLLGSDRLTYVETIRHLCAIRQQEPQDAGSDTLAFTYFAELSPGEAAQASRGLDPAEFRPNSLAGFTRDGLIQIGARPQILDLYALVFP